MTPEEQQEVTELAQHMEDIASRELKEFRQRFPENETEILTLARSEDIKPDHIQPGAIIPHTVYPMIRKAIEVEKEAFLMATRENLYLAQRGINPFKTSEEA